MWMSLYLLRLRVAATLAAHGIPRDNTPAVNGGDKRMQEQTLDYAAESKTSRLREVILFFTRLGFTAFGGPPVHVAMMEEELVSRRKWIDRQHFLDILAAVNFIPGPNSTETAIHLGLIRAGVPGLIAAGVCFVTPAMLIILPIAWLYCAYGALPAVAPALRGVAAAVVAVVFAALLRLLAPMKRDPLAIFIASLSCLAGFLLHETPQFQPELLILFTAAIVGTLVRLWKSKIPLPMLSIFGAGMIQLALVFLKIGLTLFGSGYLLINYLQTNFVDQRHWLTQQQLIDAIAVGQFTPGPLLTTATFVGFLVGHNVFHGGNVGGLIGGLVATVAIFLPSFLLIGLCAPVLQKLRSKPAARGALDGMNAAVVGLLVVIAIRLAWVAVRYPATGRIDLVNSVIFLASLLLLLRFELNATWLILLSGIIGIVRWRVHPV
jgi:chromate transporter